MLGEWMTRIVVRTYKFAVLAITRVSGRILAPKKLAKNPNMSEQKLCFIDVETTGCDDTRGHEIHQISAIITDLNGNEVLGEFSSTFQPFESSGKYDPAALEKCGLTEESLLARPKDCREGFLDFIHFLSKFCDRFDKLDKLQFVAYNAKFDDRFIRSWFTKHGDNFFGSWFWNPSICVMQSIAWLAREKRSEFANFRLETMCNLANIEFNEEDAHDARYDIQKTLELYRFLIEL